MRQISQKVIFVLFAATMLVASANATEPTLSELFQSKLSEVVPSQLGGPFQAARQLQNIIASQESQARALLKKFNNSPNKFTVEQTTHKQEKCPNNEWKYYSEATGDPLNGFRHFDYTFHPGFSLTRYQSGCPTASMSAFKNGGIVGYSDKTKARHQRKRGYLRGTSQLNESAVLSLENARLSFQSHDVPISFHEILVTSTVNQDRFVVMAWRPKTDYVKDEDRNLPENRSSGLFTGIYDSKLSLIVAEYHPHAYDAEEPSITCVAKKTESWIWMQQDVLQCTTKGR